MFTIAHEMGHALHSYYSCQNQPVNTSDYVIFVAEVASTCNEILLMRSLLSQTEDKKQRAYLINHFLDQFKGMSAADAPLTVGKNVDAITGATVSSKGVTTGVNAALAVAGVMG